MIGICTDSNAHLPAPLLERLGVEVVPITVTLDGVEYLEGVNIDADEFYAAYDGGRQPVATTMLPSPGQFAAAYEDLLARGCTEILSIHVGAFMAGTLNSARLAAHSLGTKVRLVDSGTTSFGVGCCVWAAADAVAAGANLDEATRIAERLRPSISNVFVVGGLNYLRHSGLAGDLLPEDEVPVLTLRDGKVQLVTIERTMTEALDAMASSALDGGEMVRVAVGYSDRATAALADELEDVLSSRPTVAEVIRFRLGPSVGVHTGPGTAGCFVVPAEPDVSC